MPTVRPLAKALGPGWRWFWSQGLDVIRIIHEDTGTWFDVHEQSIEGLGDLVTADLAEAMNAHAAGRPGGARSVVVATRHDDGSTTFVAQAAP